MAETPGGVGHRPSSERVARDEHDGPPSTPVVTESGNPTPSAPGDSPGETGLNMLKSSSGISGDAFD